MAVKTRYQPILPLEKPLSLNDHERRRWRNWVLGGALFCSLVLNVVLAGQFHYSRKFEDKTPYAGLSYDKAIPWSRENLFHNGNRSLEDHTWSHFPGFDGRVGVLALPSASATKLGLPPAMHWPWDKSKGVYIVEEFHVVHCLKDLRDIVWDMNEGTTPTHAFEHLIHCIDSLRQFIMCHADDTPRYKGIVSPEINKDNPHGGYGQERMCRDWDKLIRYAMENHACYWKVPSDMPGFKGEDDYKRCPDGRVLWD